MRTLKMFITGAAFVLAVTPCGGSVIPPPAENQTRHQGTVADLQSSGNFVTILIKTPQGTYVPYECPDAHALGCDLVQRDQTVLIVGHEESFIEPGCSPDGPHPKNIPNSVAICALESGKLKCSVVTP